MKILFVGDEVRHELGCAASLVMQGHDVLYLHLGHNNTPLALKTVYTDENAVKVPVLSINSISINLLTSAKRFIPKLVNQLEFDVVIANSLSPFYLARNVTERQGIPLLLRIHSIRANKLLDFLAFSENYSEILRFIPSTAHNLMQINLSSAVIVMDCSTKAFLNKLWLKKVNLVYPTYSALYNEFKDENAEAILNYLRELTTGKYVFSIVSILRSSAVFKIELFTLKILIKIAKTNPEIMVVVAGSSATDVRSTTGLTNLPKNLIFTGGVFSDAALKVLYNNATLVITPVFLKAVSNRLLEALFYGKPILTNSTAKLLHKELCHMHSVFISDNYIEYPKFVRFLLENEALLDELAIGTKKAYSSFFSARKNGIAVERVIRTLVS